LLASMCTGLFASMCTVLLPLLVLLLIF
jgi:hypothetical protein